MGTKRKAEDEILEIPSDDDDDSDVEIQEKPIPIVTVDDDDESPKTNLSHSTPSRRSPEGEEAGKNSSNDSLVTPPPAPDISKRTESSEEQEKPHIPPEKMNDNLLLSMKFRDQELYDLFKGSLTEYLKTTFQLKMGGEEVEIVQQPDLVSLQVLTKNQRQDLHAPPNPAECVTPFQTKETTDAKDDTDGMFVIDSTPAKTAKGGPIIPSYKKALQKVLDNSPSAAENPTKRPKPRQLCWNCDGDHGLKDCKQARNFAKIDKMKQAFMKTKDRYHVDLEQKYGHIVPGRLSSELRQALGLRKRDLPVHVYRMRLYGYPPGWLEDAKITHSGLQLFNSKGDPVQDSDESDGEVDNIKLKYDVRKIVSFPGFNVDAGDAYIDNSKFHGVPPRMGHQSRDEMIRNLEGTLVQGYRRKKLRLESTGLQVETDRDPADMDLDNQEDSFLTVDSVGDCDNLEGVCPDSQGSSSLPSFNGSLAGQPPQVVDEEPEEGEVDDEKEQQQARTEENGDEKTDNDDSLILVEEETEVICLDVTRADSPSLDELRRKQEELLEQLEAQSCSVQNSADLTNDDSLLEDVLMAEKLAEEEESSEKSSQSTPASTTTNPLLVLSRRMLPIGMMAPPPPPPPPPADKEDDERPPEPEFFNLDEIKMTKVPFIDDPASMGLKKMSLGTPILTPFTPFNTLPCGEAFSKGVSDVINFENLPNSTGKYERMKSLLSKVRNVITVHNGVPDGEKR